MRVGGAMVDETDGDGETVGLRSGVALTETLEELVPQRDGDGVADADDVSDADKLAEGVTVGERTDVTVTRTLGEIDELAVPVRAPDGVTTAVMLADVEPLTDGDIVEEDDTEADGLSVGDRELVVDTDEVLHGVGDPDAEPEKVTRADAVEARENEADADGETESDGDGDDVRDADGHAVGEADVVIVIELVEQPLKVALTDGDRVCDGDADMEPEWVGVAHSEPERDEDGELVIDSDDV